MKWMIFLDRYQVLKLNQDEINHLNIPITPKEIEAVIRSLPTKNVEDQMVEYRTLSDLQKRPNINTSQTL